MLAPSNILRWIVAKVAGMGLVRAKTLAERLGSVADVACLRFGANQNPVHISPYKHEPCSTR